MLGSMGLGFQRWPPGCWSTGFTMLVEKALIPSNSTATIAATGEEHNRKIMEDVSDDSVLIPLQDQQILSGVC